MVSAAVARSAARQTWSSGCRQGPEINTTKPPETRFKSSISSLLREPRDFTVSVFPSLIKFILQSSVSNRDSFSYFFINRKKSSVSLISFNFTSDQWMQIDKNAVYPLALSWRKEREVKDATADNECSQIDVSLINPLINDLAESPFFLNTLIRAPNGFRISLDYIRFGRGAN